MPLVRIEIIAGKSAEYKKQLLEGVHVALCKSLGVADWDRFQRLYELPPENFERSEGKTEQFTLIEVTMFPGRSMEQKAGMYQAIVDELKERLHIEATDVFIVIQEPKNENWGLAGIQRQSSGED